MFFSNEIMLYACIRPPTRVRLIKQSTFVWRTNTLRAFCDEEDDRKAVFRTLCYARIRLHVLCGYISKEEPPESYTQIRFLHRHQIYRHGTGDIESLRRYLSFKKPREQTTLDGNCCRIGRVDIRFARDEAYRRQGDTPERAGRILRRNIWYSPRCTKFL